MKGNFIFNAFIILAGLFLLSASSVRADVCECDVNGDGAVDRLDIKYFHTAYKAERGTSGCENTCMSCPCPDGLIECGGKCVDPTTDESNCGSCGDVCLDSKICLAGTCEFRCPDGQSCYNDEDQCELDCVDLTTTENCLDPAYECMDPANCVPSPTCDGTLSALGRWCDQGDGTVKDMTTGLVWLQDASCMGSMDWYAAIEQPITNLRSGDCSGTLTDGSAWGDWRLPTLSELDGITVGDEYIRSSSMYFFVGVQSYHYWSSTTFAGTPDYAWIVGMSIGDVNFDDKISIFDTYVWPVRGDIN